MLSTVIAGTALFATLGLSAPTADLAKRAEGIHLTNCIPNGGSIDGAVSAVIVRDLSHCYLLPPHPRTSFIFSFLPIQHIRISRILTQNGSTVPMTVAATQALATFAPYPPDYLGRPLTSSIGKAVLSAARSRQV